MRGWWCVAKWQKKISSKFFKYQYFLKFVASIDLLCYWNAILSVECIFFSYSLANMNLIICLDMTYVMTEAADHIASRGIHCVKYMVSIYCLFAQLLSSTYFSDMHDSLHWIKHIVKTKLQTFCCDIWIGFNLSQYVPNQFGVAMDCHNVCEQWDTLYYSQLNYRNDNLLNS